MNFIDFLRDALTLGRVLGVGPGSAAESIESAWGSDFLEDVHKRGKMKRRDYGLVEFSFKKDPGWICTGFMIQVHRLARHGNTVVPAAASIAYGNFPASVPFDDLAGALREADVNLEGEQTTGGGFATYSIPETHNRLYVVQGDASDSYEGCKPGEIWSISVQGGKVI